MDDKTFAKEFAKKMWRCSDHECPKGMCKNCTVYHHNNQIEVEGYGTKRQSDMFYVKDEDVVERIKATLDSFTRSQSE